MSYSNGDLVAAIIVGATIALIFSVGWWAVMDANPRNAAEDRSRISACLEAGYDRVIDKTMFQQIRQVGVETVELVCVNRLVVNGETVSEVHWIEYEPREAR